MDSYHLSVVKVEGLNEISNSYLYIYSGLNILRVLTLESFDIAPIPIAKGTLRFVIEDSQNSSLQAALSFKCEIFTRYGFHWLPLLQDSEETLTSIPEEVGLPRILIDVNSNVLSPVQEITEESESFQEMSETSVDEDLQLLKAKNIGMSVRIIELETLLENQKLSFDEEIESIKSEFGEIVKVYEGSLDQCKLKDSLISTLKETSEQKDELLAGIESKVGALEAELRLVKEREASFIRTLEQKDLEIFNLKFKSKLNLKVLNQEPVQCLARAQGSQCRENSSGPAVPGKQGKPKVLSLSTNTVSSLTTENELKACQAELNDDRSSLIKKLYDAEMALSSLKLKSLEELDMKIKRFLSQRKLDNYAHLCNELVYVVGKTKVSLFSKGNLIYCKAGGLVKKFDYFINNQCYQDIENFKRRSSVESSHKRLKTTVELDKIASSSIHKTFDCTSRSRSSIKMSKKSPTPFKPSSLSPNLRATRSTRPARPARP